MTSIEPQQLIDQFTRFRNDPYGFVLYSYPWGEEGTRLSSKPGKPTPHPDLWQIEIMEEIRERLEEREMSPEQEWAAIQVAVASGHGVGKTTLIAWLIHWFICTRSFPQIVVTAGTKNQLEKKTWRELAVWHNMSIQRAFFEWTATKFYLKEKAETWFASAIPWSEHNSDAFAGTHERYVLYIFDEASTIADIIWEVSEGAMTTEQCIWIAFGNPVRNTGRFKACFGKYSKYWITKHVDSREAKMSNKVQIAQILEQYGPDSTQARVRVYGLFPILAENQLISEEEFDACRDYVAAGYEVFPIRIGCDVAGEGEQADATVVSVIQGRKVHELFQIKMSPMDNMTTKVYTKLVETFDYWKQKHDRVGVYIDAIGIGKGIYDLLRENGVPVIGVISGAQPHDKERFVNMRIEMWYNMAQILKNSVDMTSIPKEAFDKAKEDFINIEYKELPSQKYQLESVDSLKERELGSPDWGTAICLTVAYPVPSGVNSDRNRPKKAQNSGSSTLRKKKGIKHGRN